YSASQNIVLVLLVPVAYILKLYPMLTWNTVPDDVFSFHLLAFDDEAIAGHLSQIVFKYTCPWWIGNTTIPDQPWQWDEIMASCVSHYQYWALNVEDDALVLPEKLKNTLTPPLMGLRWIKECMEALMEEQDHGIKAKMAEVKMYTDMLEKLRKGKGVPGPESQILEFGVRRPRARQLCWVSGYREHWRSHVSVFCVSWFMFGDYGIGRQGLGIQNSVESQVTSSESRVPNFGVQGSETRSSATVLGVRVSGALEIAFGLGIQNSVESQVTSSESRVPKPGSQVLNFRVRGSATRSSATVLGVRVSGALEIACGLGIQNSVESQVTSSESRVPKPTVRDSELVTGDSTLF
ncbi:uncharacterized protein F5147DRAFT_647417, partial [Suillus discolor]